MSTESRVATGSWCDLAAGGGAGGNSDLAKRNSLFKPCSSWCAAWGVQVLLLRPLLDGKSFIHPSLLQCLLNATSTLRLCDTHRDTFCSLDTLSVDLSPQDSSAPFKRSFPFATLTAVHVVRCPIH